MNERLTGKWEAAIQFSYFVFSKIHTDEWTFNRQVGSSNTVTGKWEAAILFSSFSKSILWSSNMIQRSSVLISTMSQSYDTTIVPKKRHSGYRLMIVTLIAREVFPSSLLNWCTKLRAYNCLKRTVNTNYLIDVKFFMKSTESKTNVLLTNSSAT